MTTATKPSIKFGKVYSTFGSNERMEGYYDLLVDGVKIGSLSKSYGSGGWDFEGYTPIRKRRVQAHGWRREDGAKQYIDRYNKMIAEDEFLHNYRVTISDVFVVDVKDKNTAQGAISTAKAIIAKRLHAYRSDLRTLVGEDYDAILAKLTLTSCEKLD